MLWIVPAAVAGMTALSGAESPAPNRPPTLIRRDGYTMLTAADRHVRGVGNEMRLLLARGMARSRTFSSLMTALDNTDVIVYVEFNPKMSPSTAGRLMFAAATESARYLRIQISREATANQLVAVIAHELQHAVEVGHAPDVRDEASLGRLYERIGTRGDARCFDTIEAQTMGRRVMMELQG